MRQYKTMRSDDPFSCSADWWFNSSHLSSCDVMSVLSIMKLTQCHRWQMILELELMFAVWWYWHRSNFHRKTKLTNNVLVHFRSNAFPYNGIVLFPRFILFIFLTTRDFKLFRWAWWKFEALIALFFMKTMGQFQ